MATQSVQREYATQADTYDLRWQRYEAVSIAHTLAALDPQDGEHILDAGCGTGLLLRQIAIRAPEARLFGIDLSPEMVRRADFRDADLIVADVRHLPFAEESLDAMVISSVIQYLPVIDHALSEAARVLRPGGRLVITAWDGSPWRMRTLGQWLRWRGSAPVYLHRPEQLIASCRKQGLDIQQYEPYAIGPFWRLLTLVGVKNAPTRRVEGGQPRFSTSHITHQSAPDCTGSGFVRSDYGVCHPSVITDSHMDAGSAGTTRLTF